MNRTWAGGVAVKEEEMFCESDTKQIPHTIDLSVATFKIHPKKKRKSTEEITSNASVPLYVLKTGKDYELNFCGNGDEKRTKKLKGQEDGKEAQPKKRQKTEQPTIKGRFKEAVSEVKTALEGLRDKLVHMAGVGDEVEECAGEIVEMKKQVEGEAMLKKRIEEQAKEIDDLKLITNRMEEQAKEIADLKADNARIEEQALEIMRLKAENERLDTELCQMTECVVHCGDRLSFMKKKRKRMRVTCKQVDDCLRYHSDNNKVLLSWVYYVKDTIETRGCYPALDEVAPVRDDAWYDALEESDGA